MKTKLFFAFLIGAFSFTSCDNDDHKEGDSYIDKNKYEQHLEEHKLQIERIDELETKLSATEAQLMNVKTELAKYKGPDSTESKEMK